MSNSGNNAIELAMKVVEAKDAWEDSKLQRERAETDYQYSEKQLALARQEFELERRRMLPDDVHLFEMAIKADDLDVVLEEVRSVELVGEPIGRAALSGLRRLGHASIHDLVAHLRSKGFQFGADEPARKLHAALMKQPWAFKNKRTDEWEYRES